MRESLRQPHRAKVSHSPGTVMTMKETRLEPADWEPALEPVDRAQLIVGGPGTGKTEFLVRRALALVASGVDPVHILFLSFSRRGAADLRSRFEKGLARSHGEVRAKTFHAFAHEVLESHGAAANGWDAMPSLLTSIEQVAVIKELLLADDDGQWSAAYRQVLHTQTFAGEVADFSLRANELLLTPEDIGARGRDDWKGIPQFLDAYRRRLQDLGRIDYGHLQSYAVAALADPAIADAVATTAPFVLVDELQDTTHAQLELLRALHFHGSVVVAAGDPYQSIFSFRGADVNNIFAFPERFAGEDGNPAERLVLEQSFRTPAAILDGAVRLASAAEVPGAAGPVKPTAEPGEVQAFVFDQLTAETSYIAREIQRLNVEGGVPFSSIAVFVRSKRRFLSELSRAMEHRAVPHMRPDARLADQPAIRVVFDIVAATLSPELAKGGALKRVLLGPLFRLSIGAVRQLQREHAAGMPWTELLRAEERLEALAALVEDQEWCASVPAAEGFWHLWETLPEFVEAVDDPDRESERVAWSSLSQVLARLGERDQDASLADFIAWSGADDFEAQPLLDYRAAEQEVVTVTTLHQAKGLEFDYVFIADAIDGVLPDLRPRESLIGARHLSPSLPEDPVEYRRFRLQEEGRLAYTAMTRARRTVVWTATIEGGEFGGGAPSRFFEPAAGREPSTPSYDLSPITRREAEAWLRRRLSDPTLPPSERLAALTAVAEGSPGIRPPSEFAGIGEPSRHESLHDPASELSLSPSGAESYEACPRRYAMERILRLAEETSLNQLLGTLVHEVLERTEAAALESGSPHGDAGFALRTLDDLFEPADFGGSPWAAAWKRRAAEALTNAYERRPHPGAATSRVEMQVNNELADSSWRGRIDLVQSTDGATRLVDYKTSKYPSSKDDAANSLQLGYYVLAFNEVAPQVGLPFATEAELWFPAHTTQQGVSTRDFDFGNLPRVQERLEAVAGGFRDNDWEARPSEQCDRCRYKSSCPAWAEGSWAFSWA